MLFVQVWFLAHLVVPSFSVPAGGPGQRKGLSLSLANDRPGDDNEDDDDEYDNDDDDDDDYEHRPGLRLYCWRPGGETALTFLLHLL